MRFRDHDFAEFYDMQQRDSGYPGALLEPVIESLEGLRSVLDIGSGTGFFTIPLLEKGHVVTAVEPAPEMSALILKKCPPEMKSRLTVINDYWENWNGERHDAAICIHSLYPMTDCRKGIELIHRYADKRIIIVRESSEMTTLTGEIRKRLGITLNRDFNSEIRSVLESLRADFTVKKIVEERPHRITGIENEADSILYQLRLENSFRDKIIPLINELSQHTPDGVFFNAIYSDNMYIF